MGKFTIVYGPNDVDGEPISDTSGLHLTQRNAHGGSIGDVVVLRRGEMAEITLDSPEGVQITAIEMLNLAPVDEVGGGLPEEDATQSNEKK